MIYTPSIVAGVSIEMSQFQTVYASFGRHSTSPQSCFQQLGRVRNAKQIHIYSDLDVRVDYALDEWSYSTNLKMYNEQFTNKIAEEMTYHNFIRDV